MNIKFISIFLMIFFIALSAPCIFAENVNGGDFNVDNVAVDDLNCVDLSYCPTDDALVVDESISLDNGAVDDLDDDSLNLENASAEDMIRENSADTLDKYSAPLNANAANFAVFDSKNIDASLPWFDHFLERVRCHNPEDLHFSIERNYVKEVDFGCLSDLLGLDSFKNLTFFVNSLKIRVYDQYSNPVPGVKVRVGTIDIAENLYRGDKYLHTLAPLEYSFSDDYISDKNGYVEFSFPLNREYGVYTYYVVGIFNDNGQMFYNVEGFEPGWKFY